MAVKMRDFITYTPPPHHPYHSDYNPEDLNDEIIEWKKRMKYFHDDIDWLLRLPETKFWLQITKDRTFSQSYDSFWQFCPRPHDIHILPDQCVPIHNQMKKVMLLLFLRICDDTDKGCFDDSPHASVIYDNFLVDVPKIIDVCSIYASAPLATKELIAKALGRIFQKQQGYWNDLDIAADTIIKTFDSLSEQFSLMEDNSNSVPKQLSNSGSVKFSNEELNDALIYLYDTFSSLVSLLLFFGPSSSVLLAQGVLQRAAMMVDKCLPRLRDHFQLELSDSQKRCFSRTKRLCLELCNLALKEHFFKEPNTAFNEKDMCHGYLDVINSLLPETKFVIEYEKRFNLASELSSIDKSLGAEFEENITFIKQVLNSILPDAGAKESSNQMEQAGAMAGLPNDVVESIVLQVKAMIPDEDDAFLQACVVHFDGDPEKVVNHILEGNIPPFLQEIRQSKGSFEMQNEPFKELLEERTPANQLPGNYYLKSEVKSYDIQDEIFHRKDKSRNYSDFSSAATDHGYTTTLGYLDEYDDEYDDTYDSHNIGVMDADSGDELKDLTSRRSLVKPRVLQALERRDQQRPDSYDEESDEEDNDNGEGNRSKAVIASQNEKDEMNQRPQTYKSGAPYGRGVDRRRGDGRKNGNKERQDNGVRAQGVSEGTKRGGDTRSSRGRGRGGGHGGKKHHQKSLALKKSKGGMTGF